MYKLYNVKAWGSLSIHCLLEEMEVPYTNIWMSAEQVRAPEFRELNPLGMIPALGLADGRTLFESAAIVSFLVAAHQDKAMSPEIGSAAYGDFLSMLHFMSTELYPTNNLAFAGNPYAQTPAHDNFIVERATERAATYWSLLEEWLSRKGPWLMGKHFSALDPYLFTLSIWGRPDEKTLHEQFPQIAKHAAEVRARPKLKAVLESHGVTELGGYAG